ncbi:MAG TPA: sulfatase-like hydrolase/transferase, partial [Thermoleophilaceae bacterium]|nr:sulfatase-like hydrolase/transferase [Thermoleophilaceae bacterium]
LPAKDRLPISADHPNSIFSLFAKTHRLNVSEEATSVCSRDLCTDERLDEPYTDRISSMSEDLGLVWLHVVSPPDIESDLASVSENWGDFGGTGDAAVPTAAADDSVNTRSNLNAGRRVRFEDWIANIEKGRRPALNFKHTLLPHVPWQFLPSGRRYRLSADDVVSGLSNQSYEDQGQLDVLMQRHFLQTGFTDLLLRELWQHLKREGLWDDALIVVAADHGVAFPLGQRERRRLSRSTVGEIAPIPLFMKAPRQTRGRVDDAYVETIDILPTIFDMLDLDPNVRMDGHSAFSPVVQRRRTLRMLERNTFKPITLSAAEFERQKRAVRARNARLFGSGRDGPLRLYRIGPHQELLGRTLSAGGGAGSVELFGARDYRDVDPRSDYLPTHVVGRIDGDGDTARDIAVAVNGRVAAVGNTFRLVSGERGELFSVMVPESAFRSGRNLVDVFEVGPDGVPRRLGGA